MSTRFRLCSTFVPKLPCLGLPKYSNLSENLSLGPIGSVWTGFKSLAILTSARGQLLSAHTKCCSFFRCSTVFLCSRNINNNFSNKFHNRCPNQGWQRKPLMPWPCLKQGCLVPRGNSDISLSQVCQLDQLTLTSGPPCPGANNRGQ